MTTETLINGMIEEHGAEEALDVLERNKELLQESERAKVQSYIDGVRPQIAGVMVEELDAGVGGRINASGIAIAEETLVIHQSIEDTIAQTEETREHEDYHDDHGHLSAMQSGDSAEGEIVVTIGGEAFTNEEAIEGLTVAQTGNEYVSDDYRGYERKLERGLNSAGLTIGDFEKAVDRKDLRLVDDLSRAA